MRLFKLRGKIVDPTLMPVRKWYQDRYGEYQNIIRNSNALAVNRDELLHGLKDLEAEYTPDLDFFNILYPAGLRADEIPAIGGNWDIVRNTAGTYVDRNGIIRTASNNEPRFDWLNGTPELLVEPQRTNLNTNSENLTTSYQLQNISVTADDIDAPNLTKTADLATLTSGNGYVLKIISVTNGVQYSFSVFAKKGNSDFIQIFLGSSVFNSGRLNVDLTDGNFNITGFSGNVVDYGNGWFRITAFITAASTGNGTFIIAPVNSLTEARNPTGQTVGNSIYAWGLQVEAGATETSYIPTTSATVTRNADEIELDPLMGVSEIILNDDAPITTIPSTYQLLNGRYKRVLMR